MGNPTLTSMLRKYTGLSEREVQEATWDEIGTLAEKRHGSVPVVACAEDFLYAGSAYIMTNRLGTMADSRDRWNHIGEDE